MGFNARECAASFGHHHMHSFGEDTSIAKAHCHIVATLNAMHADVATYRPREGPRPTQTLLGACSKQQLGEHD